MRLSQFVIAGLLAGCSLLPSAPPGAYDIHVDNGTTLDVEIFVNGEYVARVRAHETEVVAAPQAIALPWDIVARTSSSGRPVAGLWVQPGSVDVEGGDQRGTGARADLSCGRLDVYVGPPMMGPAPGPGAPGDCRP